MNKTHVPWNGFCERLMSFSACFGKATACFFQNNLEAEWIAGPLFSPPLPFFFSLCIFVFFLKYMDKSVMNHLNLCPEKRQRTTFPNSEACTSINASSGQLCLGFFVAAMGVFLDVLFIIPGFGCVVCLYKGAGLNRECICSSEINHFILCMSIRYRKSAFGTMYPLQWMPHLTYLLWTNQICVFFLPAIEAKKCM